MVIHVLCVTDYSSTEVIEIAGSFLLFSLSDVCLITSNCTSNLTL